MLVAQCSSAGELLYQSVSERDIMGADDRESLQLCSINVLPTKYNPFAPDKLV